SVVPAFGGLVAPALGTDRHSGYRGGRHPARRLATVAGLAPGGRPGQRRGNPGAGGRPRRLPRLRPPRGSPPRRCAVGRSRGVHSPAVHAQALAPQPTVVRTGTPAEPM